MEVIKEKRDFSKMEYRFSFVLTINDLENTEIICKRDFNINSFDESSLHSLELKESIDDIANLINRDLKSKSRTYTWYNMPLTNQSKQVFSSRDVESEDMGQEFSEPIPEKQVSTFKFTFFDGEKAVMVKSWSGDEYPFSVRNSVDLTNKKYKYDSVNIQNLDFARQIAQRASVDKSDLTTIIMKHLSSTCASFYSKQFEKKVIYKQYLPELMYESLVIDGKYSYDKKLMPLEISLSDGRGVDSIIYPAYHSYLVESDMDKWIREETEKERKELRKIVPKRRISESDVNLLAQKFKLIK